MYYLVFWLCFRDIKKRAKVVEIAGEQLPDKENRSSLLFPLNLKLWSTPKKYPGW